MNKDHNIDSYLEKCRGLYILGCGLKEDELISATKFGELYLRECITMYFERDNINDILREKVLEEFKKREKELSIKK